MFTNPNESFFLDVLSISDTPSIEQEYTQFKHFTKFSDTTDMHVLLEAQKFIQQQLQITKERYCRLNEELEAVDIEIDNAVMPPPPPTPPAVTQPSSVLSQPAQQTAPAPSKPRSSTGGATKPRASAKSATKGTKNKATTPAQPPGSAATSAVGTGGKKAKTNKVDSKSQASTTVVAAVVTSSSTATATAAKEKST